VSRCCPTPSSSRAKSFDMIHSEQAENIAMRTFSRDSRLCTCHHRQRRTGLIGWSFCFELSVWSSMRMRLGRERARRNGTSKRIAYADAPCSCLEFARRRARSRCIFLIIDARPTSWLNASRPVGPPPLSSRRGDADLTLQVRPPSIKAVTRGTGGRPICSTYLN
jgi:hypothetical protein